MTTAAVLDACDREELAHRVDGLRSTETALSDAIAWTWTRLRDAGATDRGTARRSVTVLDDEGQSSERAVLRLWTELRELGAERKRTRSEVRELCALLETPPQPEDPPMPQNTVTIRPRDDGAGWLVTWFSDTMPAPACWQYPTRDDAEVAAAALRGEPVPLPQSGPGPWSAPTSQRTEHAIYCAAKGDEGIMTALYGPPVITGNNADGWDTDELDAMVAADQAAQDAERAAKLAELVGPAYSGRLCRKPGETGHQYRRRKRIRATPEPKLAAAGLSAAYLRELRRLHDSGVLGRAETRRMMGLEPPPPLWRRVLFGAQDTADRGAYAP